MKESDPNEKMGLLKLSFDNLPPAIQDRKRF
jgi:hypothetical protein